MTNHAWGTVDTANGAIFSTLGLSYAQVAAQEAAAGVTVANLTLAWKDYETADGTYNEGQMTFFSGNCNTFLSAGMQVDIQLALHYVPSWVMSISNSHYINQFSINAPQTYGWDDPNYVFNATVRTKVQDFINHSLTQLASQVGLANIRSFRLDCGPGGEAFYSPSDDGSGHLNSYWAYDANAQGGASNRPTGVSVCPYPGWHPGDATWSGSPFTATMAQTWYDWYFASHMNFVNFQIGLFRTAGFTGLIELETPGFGTRPGEYRGNITGLLNGTSDPNGTMCRGAVWQSFYPAITNKTNVVAYISSLADGSGSPANNGSQSGDQAIDFQNDTSVNNWSGARFVSYVAVQNGLLISGENPGYGAGAGSDYGPVMMNNMALQVSQCGMIGAFWAHDQKIYDNVGTNGLTLASYTQTINATDHTFYGSSVADSTLTTACLMSNSLGGTTEVGKQTTITGVGPDFAEITSLGTSVADVTAIPTTPTGKGWIYYPGAGTFAAGNWSASITLKFVLHGSPNTTTLRVFKRSGGAYTRIGSIAATTATLAKTTYAFANTSMSSTTFASGDGLYFDLWWDDASADPSGDNPTVYVSSSSSAGIAGDLAITAPMFTPTTGVLTGSVAALGTLTGSISVGARTYYGTSIADSTLSSASTMVTNLGGVEVLEQTVLTGTLSNGEVWSQGNAGLASTSSMPSPTGHGWIYYPGAGSYASGNWSAVINAKIAVNSAASNTKLTMRFYKYSGGAYTALGSITSSTKPFSANNTKTQVALAAVSLNAFTLLAGDGVYTDLWWFDNQNNAGTDNPTIYLSSTSAGIASYMQLTTASFTLSSGPAPKIAGQTFTNGVSDFIFGANDHAEPPMNGSYPTVSQQNLAKALGGPPMLIRSMISASATDAQINNRINAIYDSGGIPLVCLYTPTNATFNNHLVTLLGSRCNLYEFGNEPTGPNTPLTLAAYTSAWNAQIPTLRGINPAASFLCCGGAIFSFTMSFLDNCVTSGIKPDGVTIHDYPCHLSTTASACLLKDNLGSQVTTWRAGVEARFPGQNIAVGFTEFNVDWANPQVSYAQTEPFINTFILDVLQSMINAGADYCQFFALYGGGNNFPMINTSTSTTTNFYTGFKNAVSVLFNPPNVQLTTVVLGHFTMSASPILTSAAPLSNSLSAKGTLSGLLTTTSAPLAATLSGVSSLALTSSLAATFTRTLAALGRLIPSPSYQATGSTSLHLYGTASHSSTLSDTLVTSLGGTSFGVDMEVDSARGWGELWAVGYDPGRWPSMSSIGIPTDRGWLYDTTALEGRTIPAGSWATAITIGTVGGTMTVQIVVRAWIRHSNGSKTAIGSWSSPSTGISLSPRTIHPTTAFAPPASFGKGDRLYIDAWCNILSGSGGDDDIRHYVGSLGGVTGRVDISTPGFVSSTTILSARPSTLTFTAVQSGANPPSQVGDLDEVGLGQGASWTSSISYSNVGGWLSISPTSGTLAPGGIVPITYSVVTDSLLPGNYSATVTYTAGAATYQVIVHFGVIVPATPILGVSRTLLTFTDIVAGNNPPAQSNTLSESAGTSTAWTSVISYANGDGWLSITPTSDTLAALGSESIVYNVATGGLDVGSYVAGVVYTATNGNDQAAVTIQFIVTAAAPSAPAPNTFLLEGQDITLYVDQFSVEIKDTLGQGAGAGQALGTQGRASTIQFNTNLGPIGDALGAGQPLPPPLGPNLYPQSTAEATDLSALQSFHTAVLLDPVTTADANSAYQCTTSGLTTFEYVWAPIAASNFLPSTTYTLSVYASGQGHLRIYMQTDVGSLGPVVSYDLSPDWARYSVTFTTDSTIPFSQAGLRVDTGTQAQATTYWLDDLQIDQSAALTDFHLIPSTPLLVRQGEIIVTDSSGVRVFGGYVTKLTDITMAPGSGGSSVNMGVGDTSSSSATSGPMFGLSTTPFTALEGIDYSTSLGRTKVNDSLAAPITDVDIIRYVMATYAPYIDISQLPLTGTFQFPSQAWNNISLEEIIQRVATATGKLIWVDFYRALHYVAVSEAKSSAYNISDSPDFLRSFPGAITEYTIDDTSAINRVFFSGGTVLSNDFVQKIDPQADGDNKVFMLAHKDVKPSSSGFFQAALGGVALVVGIEGVTGSQNALKSHGGTSDLVIDESNGTATFDIAPADNSVPPGIDLTVTYRYPIPLIAIVTDEASHAFFGDPYLDGNINDTSVLDYSVAIQRAKVLLFEQSYGLTTLKLNTYYPGLQAGQIMQVVNSVRGLQTYFVIQEITTTTLGAGHYLYEVSCGAWNWNLVDLMVKIAAAVGTIGQEPAASTNVLFLKSVEETVQVGVTAYADRGSGYFISGIAGPKPIRYAGPYIARAARLYDGRDAVCGFCTILT